MVRFCCVGIVIRNVVVRKGGGKQKGAAFEREVCKKLSLWVSGGKQEDVFWRSAVSGGRSTVAATKGKRLAAQAGDISCISPAGDYFHSLFFVECKHYANLGLDSLFIGKGNLADFWKIAKQESEKYGKHPMLIAKQNRYPTILCLDWGGLNKVFISREMWLATIPPLGLYIVGADIFFDRVKPPCPISS